MALFDFFKKKSKVEKEAENFINDQSYIINMRQMKLGPWFQYDVILGTRGYGWEEMIEWAEYINQADLTNVTTVAINKELGADDIELIESYHKSGGKIKEMTEVIEEQANFGIGGISTTLKTNLKIVWFNQTSVLRLFTFVEDMDTMERYVETVIRRTFNTDDAMKLARKEK